MPIECRAVVLEISNYIDGDVDSAMSARIESHLAGCRNCAALLASLRNVIRLYGDERLFPLPEGFSSRLEQRLAASLREREALPFKRPAAREISRNPRSSRSSPPGAAARTWWSSAIAAGLIAAVFVAAEAGDRRVPVPMSQHSQPARRVPETMVVITDDGKTFHVPGCEYVHGRGRTVPAAEAIRQGYSPCVRCERELVARRRYRAGPPISSSAASRTRGYAPDSGSTGSKWSARAISTSVASSPRARARST